MSDADANATIERDKREIAALEKILSATALRAPSAILLAMIDQLIESTCPRPEWRDIYRAKFFRGVVGTLYKQGIVSAKDLESLREFAK